MEDGKWLRVDEACRSWRLEKWVEGALRELGANQGLTDAPIGCCVVIICAEGGHG